MLSCAAVINLVKFVLSNETVLLKKFDIFVLCTRVCYSCCNV